MVVVTSMNDSPDDEMWCWMQTDEWGRRRQEGAFPPDAPPLDGQTRTGFWWKELPGCTCLPAR